MILERPRLEGGFKSFIPLLLPWDAFLFHRNQLNLEIEFLAGHFVIGVKGNGLFRLLSDSDRDAFAHRAGEDDPGADAELGRTGNLVLVNGKDVIRVRHAIGVFRHEVDIPDFTDFHIFDGVIKSFDHLAGAAGEFDGFAAVIGRIEFGAVIKSAFIVDFAFLVYVAHCILHFFYWQAGACGDALIIAEEGSGSFGMEIHAWKRVQFPYISKAEVWLTLVFLFKKLNILL